jgi:hypothetical protein
MANKLYNEESISAIADAIRTKNGTANTYTVAEMANAILGLTIESGDTGITPNGALSITENGTFDVTNYASAIVNVQNSDTESGGLANCGYVHGSFTLDEDFSPLVNDYNNNPYIINHNMTSTPKHFMLVIGEGISQIISGTIVMAYYHELHSGITRWYSDTGSLVVHGDCIEVDDVNIIIKLVTSGFWLRAGVTYHWVAWA